MLETAKLYVQTGAEAAAKISLEYQTNTIIGYSDVCRQYMAGCIAQYNNSRNLMLGNV